MHRGGMSRVTTLPAPMLAFSPMVTPGLVVAVISYLSISRVQTTTIPPYREKRQAEAFKGWGRESKKKENGRWLTR